MTIFPESALAHRWLDGRVGVEIGASAHNPFGVARWNVDLDASPGSIFKAAEMELCGRSAWVDVVADGSSLPFRDGSLGFVLSSHVLEHFPDPIGALLDWRRALAKDGLVVAVVPHRDRTFDRGRDRTTMADLIDRHETGRCPDPSAGHASVWVPADVVRMLHYCGFQLVAIQDPDDKVGNGFTVVASRYGGG